MEPRKTQRPPAGAQRPRKPFDFDTAKPEKIAGASGKKEQIFSAATTAFIDFSKQYLKGISDNEL